MKTTLARVFDEILREVETNRELRERIQRVFSPDLNEATKVATESLRRRNRRAEPALDPYALMPQGEDALREALTSLSAEELKDVISAFSLDSSRLALKWKDRARLIDLIVATVRARIEKGDAFRARVDI